MTKRKAPELVRPANPEMARTVIERSQGSRAGLHIRRTPRGTSRRAAIDYDRRAAA
jgi:hypothetical protein